MEQPIDPNKNALAPGNDLSSSEVSSDIQQALEDSQIFISYIAWQEGIEIDEKILQVLIDSKYLIKEGKWSAKAELDFWLHFDRLAEQVAPVTIESLKATLPGIGKKGKDSKGKPTDAARAVRRYRMLTIGSLIALLIFQVYWFIGVDLTRNLNKIFQERDRVDNQIQQIENIPSLKNDNRAAFNNRSLSQLKHDSTILNQRLDANYEILQHWNRVWQFNQKFEAKITEYTIYKYTEQQKRIEENRFATQEDIENKVTTKQVGDLLDEKEISERIRQLNLQKELDKARNKLFLNQLSAEFVLSALQSYLLPLLYGLLGAMTFVLRTLSTEIKTVTYSSHSEIRFRLRLSLGSLAGMIIGWFLTPDQSSGLASLGPMTIAFLTGYNVDILFSIMDKLVNSITDSIQGSGGASANQGKSRQNPPPNTEKPKTEPTQNINPS